MNSSGRSLHGRLARTWKLELDFSARFSGGLGKAELSRSRLVPCIGGLFFFISLTNQWVLTHFDLEIGANDASKAFSTRGWNLANFGCMFFCFSPFSSYKLKPSLFSFLASPCPRAIRSFICNIRPTMVFCFPFLWKREYCFFSQIKPHPNQPTANGELRCSTSLIFMIHYQFQITHFFLSDARDCCEWCSFSLLSSKCCSNSEAPHS